MKNTERKYLAKREEEDEHKNYSGLAKDAYIHVDVRIGGVLYYQSLQRYIFLILIILTFISLLFIQTSLYRGVTCRFENNCKIVLIV